MTQAITRRRLLEGLAMGVPAALVVSACGGNDGATAVADGSSGPVDPTMSPTATTAAVPTPSAVPTSAPSAPTAAATATTAPPAGPVAWASGGTNLVTVAYPSSELFDAGETCELELTGSATEGPCYFASDTGEDISLGRTGLPMQLSLRVVDPQCQPLAGYKVEVWHCDNAGVYSGDTSNSSDSSSFAGSFCTSGDSEAEASTWFRGQRTTGSDGRVNFLTCFPGWYGGRTIHIHYAISDPAGTTRLVSQFCFSDEFAAEICTTHDQYVAKGVQDTPLSGGRDTVFPSSGYDSFMLGTRQNSDGTLLAWANVQLDPDAVAAGGGTDGGPGARPGGDRPDPPDGAPPPRSDDDT